MIIDTNDPAFEEFKKYKGYDWKEFIIDHNGICTLPIEVLIKEFKIYISTSVLDKSPKEILNDFRSYLKNTKEDKASTIIRVILENHQYHKYLVQINDGSYRTNRFMYNHPHFSLLYGKDIKEENYKAKLDKIIERDEVLFIQKIDFNPNYLFNYKD